MANGNFLKDAWGRARQKLEGFLYRDEGAGAAPIPAIQEPANAPEPADMTPRQQTAPGYPPMWGQAPAAPQQNYPPYPQQPAAPQPAYQQPYQQPAPQIPQAQQPAQRAQGGFPFVNAARNRRADRTQTENKVLDFPGAQQNPPQEAPPVPQPAPAVTAAARIINARGMGDCRSAITLLRNGDAVLIVMENIADPAEMRRLVDTLSGACYSLTATITKVSRYGVYLLAPQALAVYADQATNQMNNPSARPMPQQAAYQQPAYQQPAYQPPVYQQAAYQQPAYQPPVYQPQETAYQPPVSAPQNPFQNAFAAPQAAFTQRAAAPSEANQPFYARRASQSGQMPAFATQDSAGYAPDETPAAAEQ